MVMREEERRNTAYHESGHAVIAKLLPKADPVHKVTIMPRGYALGLTWQLPEHDAPVRLQGQDAGRDLDPVRRPHRRRNLRRPDVDRRLERLRSRNQAGALDGDALRHVREHGRDGLRRHENEGFFGGSVKTISEATQQKVDAEIRTILDMQYSLARRLLEENRDKVE
jgi:cell division protease FtsH